MSLATHERRTLCDLLDEVGPDAPTLCEGWLTRDLAAHLVIRERRPDAAPGIWLPGLGRWTKVVQDRTARRPFRELVDVVRTGPPTWSPFALAPLEPVSLVEYFVHHEDVRRGRAGWQPRRSHREREAALWHLLGRVSRLGYRRSPVGVVLRRRGGEQCVARRGPRTVTVVGEPGELLLHAFGREEVMVSFEGERADIAAVRKSRRGI